MALRMLNELNKIGIPMMGAGGMYTQEHTKAMLAEAMAVQLDSLLWRGAGYNLLT